MERSTVVVDELEELAFGEGYLFFEGGDLGFVVAVIERFLFVVHATNIIIDAYKFCNILIINHTL
jgi:hypothetical protein